MKIRFLGHASLYVETKQGSVLCDPWFNPAFFGSWYPFPANDHIEPASIGTPDFLYVSHQHHDHFDRKFLTEHVSKDTWVLLPAYPLKKLRSALEECGFHKFVEVPNDEPMEVGGLRVAISALVSPSDGPTGDSGLVLDDGDTMIFNQNDSHPMNLDKLKSIGSFDGHFLQFSGAIWYPFVYNLPPERMEFFGKRKRLNQQERALGFVRALDAKHVFPCAGPPCFLDDDLFELNDFQNKPSNIFCDQTVFLDTMRRNGRDNGHLMIPDTVIELDGRAGTCELASPLPQSEIDRIFAAKRDYLEAYQARMRPRIEAFRRSLPHDQVEIVPALKAWFEPLLKAADNICGHVNTQVLFDCSPKVKFVIDFHERSVREWTDEVCPYRFFVAPALIEKCILDRCEDWVNELFLSCRFRAERDMPYNEHLYSFFKCLTPERLEYVESYYAQKINDDENVVLDGYLIQRYCPHLKADLTRFGRVENGILTCQMHGWQFDLANGGACINTRGHQIRVQQVDKAAAKTPRETILKDEAPAAEAE
jgi:UDP-MurNAc hydroxylase